MDMEQIVKQAQQFQQKMAAIQQELAKREVTSSVGAGMVTATMNGKNELLKMTIDSEIINAKDQAMLEDLVVAVVNDVIKKAQEIAQTEMAKLTGGLRIPGLF